MLGATAEGPTHGFALSRLLGSDGELGQVWTLPRPVVYQALKKLTALELAAAQAIERSERGPTRTIIAVTAAGRTALASWLTEPVRHVRDVRSELLLKLALLQRSGADAAGLVAAQRVVVEQLKSGLEAEQAGAVGFERILAAWRLASAEAVLRFLDVISVPPPASR